MNLSSITCTECRKRISLADIDNRRTWQTLPNCCRRRITGTTRRQERERDLMYAQSIHRAGYKLG